MGGEHLQCCYREQLGYALYAKFREPKLFRMAVAGDWDLVPARCRSHPKEAAFVHKYPPSDTALHRMLRPAIVSTCADEKEPSLDRETVERMNEMRLAAVAALLEANRQSAAMRDSFGRTPLHLACMDVAGSGGTAAALLILDVSPMAVTVIDLEQRTPLHFLMARNNSIPVDLLSQLIARNPGSVFRQDIAGDTPIDIAEQRSDEIDNAELVLELLKAVLPEDKVEKSEVDETSSSK